MAAGRFDLDGEQVVMGTDLAMQMRAGLGDEVLVYSPMNVIKGDDLYLPESLTVTGLFDMGMLAFISICYLGFVRWKIRLKSG